jgi:hypothetical protein
MGLPKRMQEFSADPPEKPWWERWSVLLFLIVIVLLSACCCLFPASFGQGFFQINHVENVSIQVIDDYLQAMAEEDASRAETFWVDNGQTGVTQNDLADQFEGVSFSRYTGYQNVKVTVQELEDTRSAEDGSEISRARVAGRILYKKPLAYYDYQGYFVADLVNRGEGWKIEHIDIFVAPEKTEHDMRLKQGD